jgi:hypothetical protein
MGSTKSDFDMTLSKVGVDLVMGNVGRTHFQIWKFIAERPTTGATCDEVETELSLCHSSAAARISELAARSRLQRTDKKRRTRKGRTAIVWYALPPKAADAEQLRLKGC